MRKVLQPTQHSDRGRRPYRRRVVFVTLGVWFCHSQERICRGKGRRGLRRNPGRLAFSLAKPLENGAAAGRGTIVGVAGRGGGELLVRIQSCGKCVCQMFSEHAKACLREAIPPPASTHTPPSCTGQVRSRERSHTHTHNGKYVR